MENKKTIIRYYYDIFINQEKVGILNQSIFNQVRYKNSIYRKIVVDSIVKVKLNNVNSTTKQVETFFIKDKRVRYLDVEQSSEIQGKKCTQKIQYKFTNKYIVYEVTKNTLLVERRRIFYKGTIPIILDPEFNFLKSLSLKSRQKTKIQVFNCQFNEAINMNVQFNGSRYIKSGEKYYVQTKYTFTSAGCTNQIYFNRGNFIKSIVKNSKEFYVISIRRNEKNRLCKRLSFGDLILARVKKLKQAIEEPLTLNKLHICTKLRIIGNLNEVSFLRKQSNKYQTFSGTYDLTSGDVYGKFKISSSIRGNKIRDFKSQGIITSKYLKSEINIEKNSKLIQRIAKGIIKDKVSFCERGEALLTWVYKNIHYKILNPSAWETLRHHASDCGGKANLLTAFFRCLNMPARTVGGIVYSNGYFGQHYWVEFYDFQKKVWYSADPTLGEYKFINASHIKLFDGCRCGALIHSINILNETHVNKNILFKRFNLFKKVREITYKFYNRGRYIGVNRNIFNQRGSSCVINSNFKTPKLFISSILVIDKIFNVVSYQKIDNKRHGLCLNFNNFIEIRELGNDKIKKISYNKKAHIFCLDNNIIGHYAYFLASINFNTNKHNIYNFYIDAFIPGLNQITKIYLNCLNGQGELKINRNYISCRKVIILNDDFYVDNKDLLICLRNKDGLLIKLVEIKLEEEKTW